MFKISTILLIILMLLTACSFQNEITPEAEEKPQEVETSQEEVKPAGIRMKMPTSGPDPDKLMPPGGPND